MRSLEAALWAFYRSSTFERGALLAANLGDDADTTAAIFGQLAGAFYGAEAIPESWLERLAIREFITEWRMVSHSPRSRPGRQFMTKTDGTIRYFVQSKIGFEVAKKSGNFKRYESEQ